MVPEPAAVEVVVEGVQGAGPPYRVAPPRPAIASILALPACGAGDATPRPGRVGVDVGRGGREPEPLGQLDELARRRPAAGTPRGDPEPLPAAQVLGDPRVGLGDAGDPAARAAVDAGVSVNWSCRAWTAGQVGLTVDLDPPDDHGDLGRHLDDRHVLGDRPVLAGRRRAGSRAAAVPVARRPM